MPAALAFVKAKLINRFEYSKPLTFEELKEWAKQHGHSEPIFKNVPKEKAVGYTATLTLMTNDKDELLVENIFSASNETVDSDVYIKVMAASIMSSKTKGWEDWGKEKTV